MSEKDYDELRRLGTVLHIPTPEQFWAFSVKDQYGKVTHEHKERGHSWVRNAYNILTSQMCAVNMSDSTYGPGKISAKLTAGSIYDTTLPMSLIANNVETVGYGYMGSVGSSTNGIVVGTGTTAWTFNDYVLASIIANGASTGQLAYQAGTIAKNYNSTTLAYSSTFTRIFNNNSGASITANEIGIYAYGLNGVEFMVARDVLATPVVVAAGSTLTAAYTIAVTYPA